MLQRSKLSNNIFVNASIFCLKRRKTFLFTYANNIRTICFLNKQTFRHNWRINIRLNGPMFRFKERTIFCYDLSQLAADNILPQRANVLPQCLSASMTFMNTSFPLRSSNSLIAFRCSALIQFNIQHSNLFETGQRRLKFALLHTF